MISLLLNNSTIDIDTGCRVWTGDTTYNGSRWCIGCKGYCEEEEYPKEGD